MLDARSAIAFLTGCYLVSLLGYAGVWIQSQAGPTGFANYYSNVYLVLMPLLGAILGFLRLRQQTAGSSRARRFVLASFSVGLLSWAAGGVVWSYYNFRFDEKVPYPSLADVGYLLQAVFSAIGILTMFKIAGTSPIDEVKKFWPLVTGIGGVVLAVMRWVHTDLTPHGAAAMIKFVFDIGYPIVGVFNSTLIVAVVFGASIKPLCSANRSTEWACYALLVGTLLVTVGDFVFNFTTSLPAGSPLAYYNGNWVDFVYLSGLYALASGTVLLPKK